VAASTTTHPEPVARGATVGGSSPVTSGFSLNPTGLRNDACAEIVTWLLVPLPVLSQKTDQDERVPGLSHAHLGWYARERIPYHIPPVKQIVKRIAVQAVAAQAIAA
jgi:hypothetical protein